MNLFLNVLFYMTLFALILNIYLILQGMYVHILFLIVNIITFYLIKEIKQFEGIS